jgi:cytochrome c oxidase cbb3-type subunit 3
MVALMRLRGTLPVACVVAWAVAAVGCGEATPRPMEAEGAPQGPGLRTSALEAGPATAEALRTNDFEGEPREVAEGERLYGWMNCAGCHGPQGGGGIGPPLADHDWIYGGESEHIYQSIMQGRPNGMPAFGGKVTEASAWRIAAFVRTLSEDRSRGAVHRTQQGPTDQGARSGNRQ